MRRCGQRTAMDAPVLTLPLPREAVLQGYQVQDPPVTMSDQTAAGCRSHALGINCNIPRIDSKQNILTGFFVEFWNLIKVNSLQSGARDLGPNNSRCIKTWRLSFAQDMKGVVARSSSDDAAAIPCSNDMLSFYELLWHKRYCL